MGNCKISLGNEVLIDLTQDTIHPDYLYTGITAHDNNGDAIIGSNPIAFAEPLSFRSEVIQSNSLKMFEIRMTIGFKKCTFYDGDSHRQVSVYESNDLNPFHGYGIWDSKLANIRSIYAVVEDYRGNTVISNTVSFADFAYTVNDVPNALYNFTLGSDGYYTPNNRGINNSYALARINLTVYKQCNVSIAWTQSSEQNYDYGLIGNLDTALLLSHTVDSSVKFNAYGKSGSGTVQFNNVSVGTHFIDIKYRKDSSQHVGGDYFNFRVVDSAQSIAEISNEEALAIISDDISADEAMDIILGNT